MATLDEFSILCIFSGAILLLVVILIKKEIVIDAFLKLINPVRHDAGKPLLGPRWQWPDGQIIDKFLRGKQRSSEWQKYGSVYRIWSASIPEIVITTPEDVRIFHSDSKEHKKCENGNAGWLFSQLLGDCLGLINGARWTKLRSQVDPAFSHRVTVERLPKTSESAQEYLNDLGQYGRNVDDEKVMVFHAANTFMRFPLFHTANVLYGSMTEASKQEFWAIGQTRLALLRYVIAGGIHRFKVSKWVNKSASQELEAFQKRWYEFNYNMYKNALASSPTAPIVSLWQSVLDGTSYKTEITHTLDEMLFANLDVTTHVLTWIITLLADNATVQSKLRDEIRANLNNVDDYVNKKDSYLHNCFFESLRVRPVSAFTIPESSPSVKKLGGFTIPKNTDVTVDAFAINMRNPFWGKDSATFRPERFENIKPSELRYNLFAFGFGARKCLGQHDAERAIKALVFHLLNRYEMRIRPNQNKDGDYKVDEGNWVPLSDVELELKKLD